MSNVTEAEILEHWESGTLLNAIFEQYGRHSVDTQDGTTRLIADLHNSGAIDVLGLLSVDGMSQFQGPAFFWGQHAYTKLVPMLTSGAQEIINAIQLLVQAAGEDLAAYEPVEALYQWCGLSDDRPSQLLTLVDEKIANADRYLSVALRCGVMVDKPYFLERAYRFLRSGSETEKRGSLAALSQISFAGQDEWTRLLEEYRAFHATEPDDISVGLLLSSVIAKFADAPETVKSAAQQFAVAIIESGGNHVLFETARSLFLRRDSLPEAVVKAALSRFPAIDASEKGLVQMVDRSLGSLVKSAHGAEVRAIVTSYLKRKDDPIAVDELEATFYAVREDQDLTTEWLVDWLLDGSQAVCDAVTDGLFQRGLRDSKVNVDFTRYSLRPTDYPYLARKGISVFFIDAMRMTSLLISLLRSAPAEVREALVGLLVNPILLNYSGNASTFLEEIAADRQDAICGLVNQALVQRDAYLAGLQAIGELPELRPTEQQQRISSQRHEDMMSAAYAAGRQRSVLANLFSEKVVLYGNGTIHWRDDKPKAQRVVNEFATFGHDYVIPRLEVWDPIGLRMMLMTFRSERRAT